MKIYRRLRTWIMMGLLIGVTVLVSVIMYHFQSGGNEHDWRVTATHTIEQNKMLVEEGRGIPKAQMDFIKNDILINEYALLNDIPPVTNSLWGAMINLGGVIVLITILTVIIAGDSVAGEFSTGTIKLLLIRPVSRTKVLISKYISSFVFSLFMIAILFIVGFILNSILYGFSGVSLPYLHIGSDGSVVEGNIVLHVLSKYLLASVDLIMIVTMAFMISTVFRSSSLSIGLSIFTLLIGGQLTFLLARYDWAKYILFANTDLNQYIEGRPLIEGMTMPFSIAVLLAYFILFNFLSWLLFTKRDVAA